MISRRTGQIVLVNNIQAKFGIPFRTACKSLKQKRGVLAVCFVSEQASIVVSRLDEGLYGIRDSSSRDEMGLLGSLSCRSSLIWGYHRQGSSSLKVHSHRRKDMLFQPDTVGKGHTLTQMFSPSSNTSSSWKLSPKTRTGDIPSQNGRMRGLALRKEGKKKRGGTQRWCSVQQQHRSQSRFSEAMMVATESRRENGKLQKPDVHGGDSRGVLLGTTGEF